MIRCVCPLQTAVSTAYWPACSASCSLSAQCWASVWPVGRAVRRCAAVGAEPQEAWPVERKPARPGWIVGYWKSAAGPPTVWRYVWSVAPSAFPPSSGLHGDLP